MLGDTLSSGRSPRARRRRLQGSEHPEQRRSISACAEETAWIRLCGVVRQVDLRVRGGDTAPARGDADVVGRSPRARRRQAPDGLTGLLMGSISACAEETTKDIHQQAANEVDLRVRGGDGGVERNVASATGRSPRARRRPQVLEADGIDRGSISACAEETERWRLAQQLPRVDLRVRGGDSSSVASTQPSSGRSPRARRRQTIAAAGTTVPRSISACAEETAGWIS